MTTKQQKITRRLATLDLGYNPDEKDLFDDETNAEIESHLEHLKNGGAMVQDVSQCRELSFVGTYDNISEMPAICQPAFLLSNSLTHVYEILERHDWGDVSRNFVLIEERRPDDRNRQNSYDEPFSIYDRDDMGSFRTLEDAEEAVSDALAEGLQI
mgnify:CR=1 FL=1